ncbi:MAG: AAA family ATPase [Spirochaetales bacterium]|nr:AAA family ATPase [Spirochaetales bacterium]
MNRDIEVELKRWKISSRRKPLIIQGARQVGKTYTIKSFGNTAYEDIAYFNFSSSQIIRHFPLYAVANSPRFLN